VVPTIDTELPALSSARDALAAQGTTVAVSSEAVVGIARDKGRTHEWLVGAGLPTVAQWDAADPPSEASRYPLLAKPRLGSASQGIRTVATEAEVARLPARDGYVLEEIAPGYEVTTDLYVDRHGDLVAAVPRRRLEVRGGEVSKAAIVREPALEALAGHVVRSLDGASGVLNFQSFVDPASGRVAIIELNARFGGGFPLSHRAGAAFPRWLLEERCGLPPSPRAPLQYGLVMLRYDDAVFTTTDALGCER
jgi:carbamoyl-phosphate synthase large subunit